MSKHCTTFRNYNKNIKFSEYYVDDNNDFHKEDGPAYILYDTDGIKIIRKTWFIHGICSNLEGPAILEYGYTYIEPIKIYKIDGIRFSYEEWLLHPKRIECMVKQELKEDI